jgi:hypothetical protein
MAWVPAQDDGMETRLDRTGVDAVANNIIRTARATAGFFPQGAPGRSDSFQSDVIGSE